MNGNDLVVSRITSFRNGRYFMGEIFYYNILFLGVEFTNGRLGSITALDLVSKQSNGLTIFDHFLEFHFEMGMARKLRDLYVRLKAVGARNGLTKRGALGEEDLFDPTRVFDYITPEQQAIFPWNEPPNQYFGLFGDPGFVQNDCIVHALNHLF
jgi:hypothetical protein